MLLLPAHISIILSFSLLFIVGTGLLLVIGLLLRQSQHQTATLNTTQQINVEQTKRLMDTLTSQILIPQWIETRQPVSNGWTQIAPSELIPGPTVMPLFPQHSLLYADKLASENPTTIVTNLPDKLAG